MGNGLRIGVDVGGTFTKGVVMRPPSHEILAQASVPTSHSSPQGVVAGVVAVFQQLLARVPDGPVDVVAHSTTQPVNALLEGDATPVGIIAISSQRDERHTRKLTDLRHLDLEGGRKIPCYHAYIPLEEFSDERVQASIDRLTREGARALVVTQAFSIEDSAVERRVLEAARARGVPAVAGHEMTLAYGLEVRTLTAALNASIMDRMGAVAQMVARAAEGNGITAPLLIMKGDGGAMPLAEFGRRPIATVLSGPAASVAGALAFGGVVDGLFVEVGGTSTNLAFIRNGRPIHDFVRIGPYPTSVRSLDVRVVASAGGSLPRAPRRRGLVMGPRSAHGAGLPYSCFLPRDQVEGAVAALRAPLESDPPDYMVCQLGERRFAVTPTCAANALGLVPEGDHALGSRDSARAALECLSGLTGLDVDALSTAILEAAVVPLQQVVEDLAQQFKLDSVEIVGGGGAASVLVPVLAKRLGQRWRLVPQAQVISAIGVALSMLRVEREVAVGASDLDRVIGEVERELVAGGADPASLRISTEHLAERGSVRIVGLGAVTVGEAPVRGAEEIAEVAARALGIPASRVSAIARLESCTVFAGPPRTEGLSRRIATLQPIAVVDDLGSVHFASQRARALTGDELAPALQTTALRGRERFAALVVGHRIIDLDSFSDPLGEIGRAGPRGDKVLIIRGE